MRIKAIILTTIGCKGVVSEHGITAIVIIDDYGVRLQGFIATFVTRVQLSERLKYGMQTHVFGKYNHRNDVDYHLLGHEINLANCLLDGSFDLLLLFIFDFLSDLVYTDF